jgi:pimeloyl-ACP methyl ester carboxylesterase
MSKVKTIKTTVAEIGYEESGSELHLPVVLLHGFPDDVRTWDGVIERLSDLQIRILRPYLRGYGPTGVFFESARSGQVAALAQDLLDFIDALRLGSILVVGHDWGARAAQVAAMLAPHKLRGMVTIASCVHQSAPDIDTYLRQNHAFWYQLFFLTPQGERTLEDDRIVLCRYLWRTWSPTWNFPEQEYASVTESFQSPQFVQTVTHYYRHRWNAAAGAAYYQSQDQIARTAPPVAVPHTFICGSADACTLVDTSENLDRYYMGGYNRIVVEGAGHFVQRERPEIVVEQVRTMLRALGSAVYL